MIIRLHTENKNRNWIESLIGLHFSDGFSISEQVSHWKGGFESSLCIEIDMLDGIHYHAKIADIASELKFHNNQEAVWMQEIESNSYLA